MDDGSASTLGVSGKLWRDALVMYDRSTRSLWSQIDGRARAGPREGEVLRKIPSQMTTWANWRARHPDTKVLRKPRLEASPYESYHRKSSWVGLPWTSGADDDRLPKKTLVLGVDHDGQALAVPLDLLQDRALLQAQMGETPLLVVAPDESLAALVYLRRLDERTLDFVWDDAVGVLRDRQTGSRWNWRTGRATSGPLEGRRLEPVPASPVYWTTWASFFPGTEVVSGEI